MLFFTKKNFGGENIDWVCVRKKIDWGSKKLNKLSEAKKTTFINWCVFIVPEFRPKFCHVLLIYIKKSSFQLILFQRNQKGGIKNYLFNDQRSLSFSPFPSIEFNEPLMFSRNLFRCNCFIAIMSKVCQGEKWKKAFTLMFGWLKGMIVMDGLMM